MPIQLIPIANISGPLALEQSSEKNKIDEKPKQDEATKEWHRKTTVGYQIAAKGQL